MLFFFWREGFYSRGLIFGSVLVQEELISNGTKK